MSIRDDWSWSASALYACPCGALVAVQRWRWIDCDARPELAAKLRAVGPFVGACSRCRRAASGGGAWLEVAPGRASATLVLSADRRGDLITALQAHLADVQARTERAAPWLLQPAVAFAPPAAEGWPDAQVGALAPWPAGQVEALAAAGQDEPPPLVEGEARAPAGPEWPAELMGPPRTGAPEAAPERPRAGGPPGQDAGDRRVEVEVGPRGQDARDRSGEVGGPRGQDARDRSGEGGGPRGQDAKDRSGRAEVGADRPARAAEEPARAAEIAGGSRGQDPGDRSEPARGERAGARAARGQELGDRSERADAGEPARGREPRGAAREDEGRLAARGAREGSGPTTATESGGAAEAGRPAPRSGRPSVPPSSAGSGVRSPEAQASEEERRSARGRAEATLEDTFPGRRAPRAVGEGEDDAEATPPPRRAPRGPEATGPAGQGPTTLSPKPAEEVEVGERSALRAAVARALSPASQPPAPARRAEEGRPGLPAPRSLAGREPEAETDAPRPRAGGRPSSNLRVTPDVQPALLATLSREGGAVQVVAALGEATARVWSVAPIKVRPILLRGLGFPLVGVRCVAEASEPLVIDAVLDVGEPQTAEVFKQLAQQFRVRLVLRSEGGATTRDLVAPELQRNAAACLESAQSQLRAGEYPQDAYRTARELLAGRSVAQRLEPARNSLSEEMIEGCRASAAAAWGALERLDLASRKDSLARMLEVDGLPLETYEAIRSAVLAAAVEFGLPAPARFWRRWLASDQASDLSAFVVRLVAARSASVARGEDLTPEQAEAAWRGLLDLCQHKDLTPPPELAKALGLGRGAVRRSSQAPVVVSGEIRDAAPPSSEAPRASAPRVKDLLARLEGSPTDADLRAVFAVWGELSEADLAGLLPAIAELGVRVVPDLLPSLRAPQRQVRQAAAILLGHFGDRKAVDPLIAMLGEEPTAAWIDAAQALGNFGPRVVGPLCALVRGAGTGRKEALGGRLARALSALARAEGEAAGSPGRQAVENLLDVGDLVVASAARRALATLGAVRDEGAGDEAEASRRFSQLASDAITAPELDAFADDEIDELEVEVGED